MSNIVIYPILIPLLMAMVLVFFRENIKLQQWLTGISVLVVIAISAFTVYHVSEQGIVVLELGGWSAPYGIVLVGDMLAVLLVTVASFVTLMCLLFGFNSFEMGHKRHFVYPMILVLLSGVNGSFLTGDLFNLFVFFEVMLIASYVLIVLGGKKIQLRESIKYVLINVISSTLFVIATGYLYSVTGTLNMAHLSERVAMAGQDGLLTAISFLFLTVFGLKSGLLLFFWLPGSYSAPPAPIAALFAALLTKVGVYTVIRVFTLIFYHDKEFTHTAMMWMAAITMILGALGAVSQWEIKKILSYNVIVSVGFILFGVSIATDQSLSGSLFYLIHDMLSKALIFITGGAIISIFGTDKLKEFSGLILFRPLLGWLFFIGVLALAGVPPLGGFVGKVMILKGAVSAGELIVSIIGLLTSLLVLYSVMKIFIHSFWGETLMSEGQEYSTGTNALLPGTILVICIAGMGIGAEWIMTFISQATEVMVNPSIYIEAVLQQISP
ncbi:MAG: Na+/H+ antiporter subunit D [Candidatus Pristimantibacillus lignocellulolyticus]|uniref:Na+/H+ antiporter subunit D n=1 Tax=Candidatus Pristimantibacillus lignocellulolyticus TaxID=2994561 RepID=A0A9J6ZJT2_9BACL|nr:MAG: Na+/H+ antiporter subunit D [Candidatus Pristimantibacillus lignocellulolyticus]